jgi:hypothetical protein
MENATLPPPEALCESDEIPVVTVPVFNEERRGYCVRSG